MKDTGKKNDNRFTAVTVNYDSERLSALYKYMGDKNLCLENEIVDVIEHLYERHVPPSVKQYIDFRAMGNMDNH